MNARCITLGAAAAITFAGVANGTILFQDNFSGPSVDTSKWTMRSNFGGPGSPANNVIDSGRLHNWAANGSQQEMITNDFFSSSNLYIKLDFEKPSGESGGYYTAIQYGDDINLAWQLQLGPAGNALIKRMVPPGTAWGDFQNVTFLPYAVDTPGTFEAILNAAGN